MFDGSRLSLVVLPDGRFNSSLDGGDVGGSAFGVWEASTGGLVLLPSPGECVLRDGNFDDACLRVFDTDLDSDSIRVAQQQSYDEVVSFDWQRASDCGASLDLTPRDEGNYLCGVEAASADLEAIELHFPSYPGDVGRGRLKFSLTADLSVVDPHDLQRNLLASIQTFSLQTLSGSEVARFGWHVPGLSEAERADPDRSPLQDEPGEFRIQAQRGLAVDFVHELTALPEQLELHYEFEGAKYILDSGPRVARLPVTE
jgi:hypothetical protein